jgi:DNA-binding response OmpR family regulator
MGNILIVAVDSNERNGLALVIELGGHDCATASSLHVALDLLKQGGFDLVVTEAKLEGIETERIARNLKDASPLVKVMMLSEGSVDEVIPGVDFFTVIPCSPKKLQDAIRSAIRRKGSRFPPGRVLTKQRVPTLLTPARGKSLATRAGSRT